MKCEKANWKQVNVGNIGKIVTGKTPKTSNSEFYDGDIPFLTPSDDMSVKYVRNTKKHITELGKASVKNYTLPANSICVSCIGSDLGKVVITTEETVTNQQINSVIVDENKFDIDFIYYSMLQLGKILNFHSKTSTAVPIVNKSSFSQYKIICPDINTQRKIGRILSDIDDKIELNNAINDNLRATGIAIVEKSVGTAAQINKTQAELDSILLPEGWSITTVSEFCTETKSGATPSRSESSFWHRGTIPWLKSGEVHNGISLKTEEFITQSALENSSVKLLHSDTVLMAMYGVTAGEVGYLAIPATTNQAVCGMVCSSQADAAYLFFALLQNQDAASRLSNGGAQDNLSKNFIDGIHLICPPEDFIKELQLSALIENLTLVSKEIDCLEQLQATILAELSSR